MNRVRDANRMRMIRPQLRADRASRGASRTSADNNKDTGP